MVRVFFFYKKGIDKRNFMAYNCTITTNTVGTKCKNIRSAICRKIFREVRLVDKRNPVLNRTTIRRDILRHWPIWSIAFLFYFFAVWLSNTVARGYMAGSGEFFPAINIMDALIGTTNVVAFAMGLAASWAAFGFTGNRRKHYFYESLPYNRRDIFVNRFVFGFTLCIIPCVAIFFMEFFQIFVLCGSFETVMLVKWFIASVCEYFFWYSLGVLFFTVSGRVMMAAFCYIFFSVVGYLLSLYLELLNLTCYIGFDNGTGGGNSLTGILCPIQYVLGIEISDYKEYDKLSGFNGQLFIDGSVVKLCIIFAVGLILTIAAFMLYRRRKSERTGDTFVFGGMKYVFLWTITFFATISVSILLYSTLFYRNDAIAHRPGERVKLIVILIVVGFLLFMGSCMIVEKKFKVFKVYRLKALIFIAALAILGTAYLHDAFNIEGYVPKADKVKYINKYSRDADMEIYFLHEKSRIYTMSDRKTIERVIGLHELVLDNMDELEDMYLHTGNYDYSNGREPDYYYMNISYKLKNDTIISRSYMICEGSELDRKVKDYLGVQSFEQVGKENDQSYMIDPEER